MEDSSTTPKRMGLSNVFEVICVIIMFFMTFPALVYLVADPIDENKKILVVFLR